MLSWLAAPVLFGTLALLLEEPDEEPDPEPELEPIHFHLCQYHIAGSNSRKGCVPLEPDPEVAVALEPLPVRVVTSEPEEPVAAAAALAAVAGKKREL